MFFVFRCIFVIWSHETVVLTSNKIHNGTRRQRWFTCRFSLLYINFSFHLGNLLALSDAVIKLFPMFHFGLGLARLGRLEYSHLPYHLILMGLREMCVHPTLGITLFPPLSIFIPVLTWCSIS